MKLEIEGERIKLRRPQLSDADNIYKNLQDKETVRWTFIPQPYKKQDAIKWIRKTHYRIINKKEYHFAIVLKTENRVIGAIALMAIDWKNKNAELGYWLGKRYWGKGFTTEAVKLILRFAFEKLKLRRIHAFSFEENIASRRVLEKCGFKLEGIMREGRYKDGRWHNMLIFGLLKQEYMKNKKCYTRLNYQGDKIWNG